MGALQRFEQRLENLISGAFARAFRSAVQPVEISAALQREVDNNSQILSRDRRLAPNVFHVELSDADLERLSPYDNAMARDLSDQLEEHADAQGYVFPGDIEIHFEQAGDLPTGQMRVRSAARASVSGGGQEHRAHSRTPRAVLEINGTRHPLLPPGVVVGRGAESDVRINDPGVSRRHVEFECAERGDGPYVTVSDLGSTNGMLVDGQRVDHARLGDGSTVKIGSTVVRVLFTHDDDSRRS
ncbi:DUF3662 and FHA domain-containing protein [Nocardioides sp. Y6]|uniref:DUF3662 and FHA domain-containing protein n=1 Tax=Nocardioides malaquae TaxID=2773426 RepID=A0ABR9RTP9_9ACTN|nr:DUF3662 and FHA domain-containing protein [Nocardioides malaquae]MBE7324495.1 DUF3662 and FHA domain-containing protein [Nocardioides malaquae]